MSDIPKSISLLFDKIKYKNFIHFFTIPLRYVDERYSFWKYLIRKILHHDTCYFFLKVIVFSLYDVLFYQCKKRTESLWLFWLFTYIWVFICLHSYLKLLFYIIPYVPLISLGTMSKYTFKRSFICNKFVIYSLDF